MVEKIKIKRTATPNKPPEGLVPGELSVEMADPTRLWVGVPPEIDPTGKKLLIDVDALNAAAAAVAETPPPAPTQGVFWYEKDTGILWMWYDDGSTAQWVQVNGISVTGSGLSGGDVSGPVAATPGNAAVFADATGKVITDGGPVGTGNMTGPASSGADHVALFDGVTGKFLKDGGPVPTGNVTGPATAVDDHVAVFSGTTGKVVRDGGPKPTGNVAGPAAAAVNNLATFADASGKVLKDGGPIPPAFPAGTQMLFLNGAAPVGWTKNMSINDTALRVVNGTSGGSLFGVNNFSFVFGKTAVDPYTITNTYMGVASVGINTASSLSFLSNNTALAGTGPWGHDTGYASKGLYITAANNNEGILVGGQAHSHTIDMRVTYVDAIAAVKN